MTTDAGGTVTVWSAPAAAALALPGALSWLGPEETARAERLRRAADRDRFLAARALLRHALSRAVEGRVAPAQWRYGAEPNRKPAMASGLPPLEFNLSHTDDCIAVAVSAAGPVGVDVEHLARIEHGDIARRVLSERERARLDRVPSDRRRAAFLRIWTVKEACAKALGLGLSLDFRRLEVALDPVRVHVADGLLAGTRSFDVATRTLERDGRAYALSVATTPEPPRRTRYRFEECPGP